MLLGILAATLTATQPQAEEPWHTMTGPDNGFTAELPSAPKYTATQMKTVKGSSYTVHQYLVESGERAFIVQSSTYPTDVDVSKPEETLKTGLSTTAKKMEGKKWSSVDWIDHQGSKAVDVVGKRNGQDIRSYSVIHGSTIFTLIYAGPAGSARSPEVNRFVASLKITK
jgi:hypothetical protein